MSMDGTTKSWPHLPQDHVLEQVCLVLSGDRMYWRVSGIQSSFWCKLVMPGHLKPTSAKGERQLIFSLLMVGRKGFYI